MKTHFVLATLSFLLAFPAFGAGQTPALPGQAAASTASSTGKALVIQVEVPAPLPAVWQAFSTGEGLSTWLGPNATVDLRPGGDWTVHFPNGSTGGGTIISFDPQKELLISAVAPDSFPTVRATRTHAVFSFEAHGDATIVRLTQTGWKEGAEWDHAYEYLVAGNAQLLSMLHRRFLSGPIDWNKLFSQKE
jgi:uncharacterized protein YndB with AHSA1/START domain